MRWLLLVVGGVVSFLGLIATSYAANGGALEWLWIGGLIVVVGIAITFIKVGP